MLRIRGRERQRRLDLLLVLVDNAEDEPLYEPTRHDLLDAPPASWLALLPFAKGRPLPGPYRPDFLALLPFAKGRPPLDITIL